MGELISGCGGAPATAWLPPLAFRMTSILYARFDGAEGGLLSWK